MKKKHGVAWRMMLFTFTMSAIVLLGGCAKSENSNEGTTLPVASADSNQTVPLTVWGNADDQKVLTEMVEGFKQENTDKKYEITVRVVEEGGAREEVLKDTEAAADVFSIPADQLGALVAAGAVYENTKYADAVRADNIQTAVSAATYDGKVYGYPVSSETYYLTYNKSFFTEEDVQSLNKMLEKQFPEGVTAFANDFGSAYTSSAFFFANGCELFGKDGQDLEQVTFNSPEGLAVANYIRGLKDKNTLNINGDIATSMFKEKTLGAFYAGPWKANVFKEALGDDYAVAKLPAIDFGNGDKQMISFGGIKMLVVKATTKYPEEAMALAEYLSNTQNQLKRFEERSLLPTNTELLKTPAILENETLKTVIEQLNYSFAMPATPQMSKYWTPMASFIKDDYNGLISEGDMQQKLDALVADIKSK